MFKLGNDKQTDLIMKLKLNDLMHRTIKAAPNKGLPSIPFCQANRAKPTGKKTVHRKLWALYVCLMGLSPVFLVAQIAPQVLQNASMPNYKNQETGNEMGLEAEERAEENTTAKKRRLKAAPILKTSKDAQAFFGQSPDEAGAVVDNVSFSHSAEGTSLFAEFLSDYLYLGKLGYGRIGFGALVNAAKDQSQTTLSQFMSGGGNGMLYLFLPIASTYNPQANQRSNEILRANLIFLPRLGLDIPALNTAIINPGYNADVGLEVQALMASESKLFQFFGSMRGSIVVGSTSFYQNLGLGATDVQPFPTARYAFGVVLNRLIRISFSRTLLTKRRDGLPNPIVLSVQLINR